MDYVQIFDLKPNELALKILVCSKENTQKESSQSELPSVEFVEPQHLQDCPYPDQHFDLVLCSNILFTNSNNADEAFHLAVLMELMRVGSEVRVYPLVNQKGEPAKYLGSVIQSLQEKGIGAELRQVPGLGKDSLNAMLRLWNPACLVKREIDESEADLLKEPR